MLSSTITIVGNLSADPELHYTSGGIAVTNFTIAVNSRYKKGEQWEDKLEGFFRCNAWREMAEHVAESLTKGQRVLVTGKLQQRHWEDADGNKRQAVDIEVEEVGPSLKFATAAVTKAEKREMAAVAPADEGGF
ncbi:MAG: single-stranded DNA-binding protein [Actinobacteria bacterium]|nr:single-stranded DNA-binding protein [Actinomycetota bacterium]